VENQIIITPLASEQIKLQLAKRGTPNGYLRLGITTGCSDYKFSLCFEEAPRAKDLTFRIDDINLLVDPKSMIILDGTTLDYQKTLTKSGFFFNSPKVKATCGCGNSFSL
jgi:iron-sulfur cluster assembly protein